MINLGLDKKTSDASIQESTLDDILDNVKVGGSKVTDFAVGNDNIEKMREEHRDKTKTKANPDGDDLPFGTVTDLTVNKLGNVADKMSAYQRRMTPNNTSIIARAKNSIAQFPIYISLSSIRVNQAHVIAKTFEKVYANFLQTVLSHNPVLNEDDLNSLTFLKQFHTNLREAADVLVNKYYEPIDDFDRMMCESIFYEAEVNENVSIKFSIVPTVNEDLILENARLMNEPLSGIAYLREDVAPKQYYEVTSTYSGAMTDGDVEHYIKNINKNKTVTTPEQLAKSIDAGDKHAMIGGIDKNGNPTTLIIKHTTDSDGKDVFFTGQLKISKDDVVPSRGDSGDKKSLAATPVPTLLPADIKKINGLLPLSIEVTFRVKSSKGEGLKDVKFIIGIKTVLHPISYSDLAEDLRGLITGNVKSLQKVRYNTGEISLKDYLFNTKQLKADAAKHINHDKRWLNTLKRLAEYDKMNGGLFMKKPVEAMAGGSVPIPNGTLVLSQADVGNLVNDTGIDLNSVSNAKRLARTLFLIAVVVVDSTAGTMKVLFPDSDTDWDVQSLDSLEAEVSKTDNSKIASEFNKIINRGV